MCEIVADFLVLTRCAILKPMLRGSPRIGPLIISCFCPLGYDVSIGACCYKNASHLLRTKTVEQAKAEAEKIKRVGSAEASSIEAVGKAEAESMRLKASAYKQYGDAALMSLILESLPKVIHRIFEAGFCGDYRRFILCRQYRHFLMLSSSS